MYMLHTKHRSAFPVPKILLTSSVGLDISDQSIKYAELIKKNGQTVLGRFGSVQIPEGVIASGKVIFPQKLSEVLTTLREKERMTTVRVALPEEQVYLFRLHLENVSFSDIRNSVEIQLEEHIPISANEAVFDFSVIDSHDNAFDLQVVATSRELVDGYLEALSGAKLNAISFELEAEAIARSIIKDGDKGTVMVIDFGGSRTGISVMQASKVLFTSTAPVGGHGVSQAISRALNISYEEAEKIKQSTGLSEDLENREAFGAMVGTLAALRDEINRTYTYWHTQKDDEGKVRPKIETILLCGGDANLPGLVEYLKASLRIPVALANPWINITDFESYIPDVPKKQALSLVTAIGLALADFEYE